MAIMHYFFGFFMVQLTLDEFLSKHVSFTGEDSFPIPSPQSARTGQPEYSRTQGFALCSCSRFTCRLRPNISLISILYSLIICFSAVALHSAYTVCTTDIFM